MTALLGAEASVNHYLTAALLTATIARRASGQAVRKDRPLVSGLAECALGAVDTSNWVRSSSDALGVSFLHPRSYQLKDWGSVSPGAPTSWSWWHEDGPVWSVEFTKVRAASDSARRAAYRGLREHRTCALRTSAGTVTVHLFRNGTAGYGANAVTLYNAEMDWPLALPGASCGDEMMAGAVVG
jgi:hypothetical protein